MTYSAFSQYRTSTSSSARIRNYSQDYTYIGLTNTVFKPSCLCSLQLLSDDILDCSVWYSIVSSSSTVLRAELNLSQFPTIVPRHVATKYESILTPERSCKTQERNHFHWWSRIFCFGRKTFCVILTYKFSRQRNAWKWTPDIMCWQSAVGNIGLHALLTSQSSVS